MDILRYCKCKCCGRVQGYEYWSEYSGTNTRVCCEKCNSERLIQLENEKYCKKCKQFHL